MASKKETVVFGGGCFWCTEALFLKIKGVENVTSGYAGGKADNPNYETVSSGQTGHAEVVKIDFDPEVVSLKKLIEVFVETHDATSLNRQGNDIGTQYRSIVLCTDEAQEEKVKAYINEIAQKRKDDKKVVTEIGLLTKFFTAEEYHQKFYDHNPNNLYCSLVIFPKLKKLEEKFSELLKR